MPDIFAVQLTCIISVKYQEIRNNKADETIVKLPPARTQQRPVLVLHCCLASLESMSVAQQSASVVQF